MDAALLSPDSAKSPEGYFGAGVRRRDTIESITGDNNSYSRLSRGDTIRGSIHQAPDSPRQGHDSLDDVQDSDIASQQKQYEEPTSAHTSSPMLKQGEYGLLENFQFDSDTRSLLSTHKNYDHREARKDLFKTGFHRFLVTLVFCALIALSLKAFEGFRKPLVLSNQQTRYFNALMLGLSLGLGLNLASSLKRYAVILRWALLTKRYVSLEVFDLILGLETLTKVAKLMVISFPGIRKIKSLRNRPWFRDARDDGTRLTWIACLLWILVNIGAQVLVAALSLFWPVDPSDALPLLTYGNVTVSDLIKWKDDPIKTNTNASSMEAAWFYGTEAMVYPVFQEKDSQTDLSSLPGSPYYRLDGHGGFEYRFFNRNPEHQFTNYLLSSRKIRARAKCTQLETKNTTYEQEPDDGPFFMWGRVPGEDWEKHMLPQVTTGSVSWIGSVNEHCGPRCTNFTVFQNTDTEKITQASLFLCDNTVFPVTGGEHDFDKLRPEDHDHLYSNDAFARIAAGAMAWTGYPSNGWDDRQTRSYTRGSQWSPYKIVTREDIEDMLAQFSIGALAAFDDHGLRYTVTNQRTRPVQGQQLKVEWPWVGGLLGGICVIQFAALICLLNFANKSIIRDESYFSLAMLLSPVVNRIGREGMALSGEQIKLHPKLMWKRIRYDYEEGKDGEPNQVKISFQGKDRWEARRSWASGVYAG